MYNIPNGSLYDNNLPIYKQVKHLKTSR